MNDILISVIVPTYRRLDMLRQALESIKMQNYSNIEIIVVDDCSCDGTNAITKEFSNIHYYENTVNSGPGLSRKRGLQQARGKYIVFLDDDDFYIDSTFFASAVDVLEKHPEYVFYAARALVLYHGVNEYKPERFNVFGEMDSIEYLNGFAFKYSVPQTFAIVFTRVALQSSGVFDSNMVNHMPMIMRCLQTGKVYFSDKEVGVYRQHETNISKNITADFIIKNLSEKYDLLAITKDRNLIRNSSDWWFAQIKTTTSYFIYGSLPSIHELNKVKQWCIKNSQNKKEIRNLFRGYRRHLINCNISEIKSKIRGYLERRYGK